MQVAGGEYVTDEDFGPGVECLRANESGFDRRKRNDEEGKIIRELRGPGRHKSHDANLNQAKKWPTGGNTEGRRN
jgi:hypothetical protein